MRKIKTIVLTSILYFFVFTIQVVLIHKFINPIITPLMVARVVEGVFEPKGSVVIKKNWRSMKQLSPNMIIAVMASEDQRFLVHHGFDWEAIKAAMKYNEKKKGKKIRGASTISQQTAKNVFLWPSRSWVRKGLEVYFTFLIEALWSKERIMEVYLNVIEMGNGIYGAEAAAKKYYKTSALNLSKKQAASIAAILPLPQKWSPVKPSAHVSSRINWIRNQMNFIEAPVWTKISK